MTGISEPRSSKYNSGRNFWRASTRLISWPGIILEKEQPCLDKGDLLSHPTIQRLPPTPTPPPHTCPLWAGEPVNPLSLPTLHFSPSCWVAKGWIHLIKIVPKLNPFCQWIFEICKNHLFMRSINLMKQYLDALVTFNRRKPNTSSITSGHCPRLSKNVLVFQWKEVNLYTAAKMTTSWGAKSETKVEGISLSGLQWNSLLHFLDPGYFAHYST